MKRVHFVGIKGSGMSALAQLYIKMGYQVSGSDTEERFFTDELLEKAGITDIRIADEKSVFGADFICHSSAYNNEHPEIKKAIELGIPVFTYSEALGKITNERESILVSGTHGKTTTTSMISSMLLSANKDPMVVIGSKNYNIGSNAKFGDGMMVLESCEYKRNFLQYTPHITIVNNIDFDHPDYFKDINDVFSAFQSLVDKIPEEGTLIAGGDDERCRMLETKGRKIYFGLKEQNDIFAKGIEEKRGFIYFTAYEKGAKLGDVKIRAIGKHNVLNALATIALSRVLGIPFENVQHSLENFGGVYRRFDFLGMYEGALVYDDYAHHPNEILTTLCAIKESFKEEKLITIFQPHTYTRTRKFLNEFADSLAVSDEIVLVKIFASAREKEIGEELNEQLALAIQSRGKEVIFAENTKEAKELVKTRIKGERNIAVTMGAGNIREVGESLISEK